MLPHFFSNRRNAKSARIHQRRRGWAKPSLELLEDRTLLAVMTVNSAADTTDRDNFLTLREAILLANGKLAFADLTSAEQAQVTDGQPASNQRDNILFVIGTGPKTIMLQSSLIITDSVSIDGTSQPGYAPGKPQIQLDGSQAGTGNGLEFQVGGNEVEGLIINNFKGIPNEANGFAIVLQGSNALDPGNPINNFIHANFIGTDASGKVAVANNGGILVHGSSHNIIGGLNNGTKLTQGNLISGNSQDGIFIDDQNCTDNHIEGNFIGTDVTGNNPVGNGLNGVFIGPPELAPALGFASGNFVSNFDVATNKFDPNGRNVISGNLGNGVYFLVGSGNQVQGSYIGIGADGKTPVPNAHDGVLLEDTSANVVGGIQPNSGNVISGNLDSGVEIRSVVISENFVAIPVANEGAVGNLIQGNYVGTNAAGTVAIANQSVDAVRTGQPSGGIVLRKLSADISATVSGNTIGGDDQSDGKLDGITGGRNIISGNLDNGIVLIGQGVIANSILGNFIGTDVNGIKALPNTHEGILLSALPDSSTGPSLNVIGSGKPGGGNLISGNGVVKDNDGSPTDGIRIGHSSNENFIVGNRIGTKQNGIDILPNVGNGVAIDGAALNIVGGNLPEDQNIIGGNLLDGVLITGSGAMNNLVQRNLIGIAIDLTTNIGNQNGVHITSRASANVVGGTELVGDQDISLGNSIASNRLDGIIVENGSNFNNVVGNVIGTDPTFGKDVVGNGVGVDIIDSSDNTIGGISLATRNYIVNSSFDGIDITDTNALVNNTFPTTAGNVIEGNYIGIGNDGVTAMGNGNGVVIQAAIRNTIGGGLDGTRNVISGNRETGVTIQNAFSVLNVIAGNYIGTDANGTKPVGNATGISVEAGAGTTQIGGGTSSKGNVISGNKLDGVDLSSAGASNSLTDNLIGVTADGTSGLGNKGSGIVVIDTPFTLVGDDDSLDRNIVSGNLTYGISIGGAASVGTLIKNNFIGIDANESGPIPNALGGLLIGAIGKSGTPASQSVVTKNVISGNNVFGIGLDGGTSLNLITGNSIGTNRTGNADFHNSGIGIEVEDSPNNFVGDVGAGNTIVNTALNVSQDPLVGSGYGILILGAASTNNRVKSNIIDDNANEGIRIAAGASGNTIGGSSVALGNAITKNFAGIAIVGLNTSNNTVDGNSIGIGVKGAISGSVLGDGIFIGDHASKNTIGDAIPKGIGNVIVASAHAGITITQGAAGNQIVGNFIGVDRNGVIDDLHRNKTSGIVIQDSSGNTIGGEIVGSSNLIAGNTQSGILIKGAASTSNTIWGNKISGNKGGGIFIDGASNNTIGGVHTADSNSILANGAPGVIVLSGTGNALHQNIIFANVAPDIDLGNDGPTPNDDRKSLDRDTGPDNLQNFPVLDVATKGMSHHASGTLESAPNGTYTVELFAGPSAEDGQNGAKRFLLSMQVTTSGSGVGFFDVTLPDNALAPDETSTFVMATATDKDGNTSEFSTPRLILADSDGDGIPDLTESFAPNGGDGNGDGKLDSEQPNVASFPDFTDGHYVSLEAPVGIVIQNARTVEDPDPDNRAHPRTKFQFGLYSFTLTGVQPPGAITIREILPGPASVDYYRYGPTPGDATPHWYNWLFDEGLGTGAEVSGNIINLHFSDGGFGDDDLTINGVIVDAGGPGFPDSFTVTSTADHGPGSLRQVIQNANDNPGPDEIAFDIQAAGPISIHLLSPLPALTDSVTIDGATQPGFAGTPIIEIDGSQAGPGADSFTISSGTATIQDLVISGFSGNGIHVLSAGSAQILDNYIGTDISGTVAFGNKLFGVDIENTVDSSDDEEADVTPTSVVGNVISGNLGGGVFIHGIGAIDNTVESNRIGTQADGTHPLGNNGPGVRLDDDADSNLIGFASSEQGNIIAFNAGPGVEIDQARANLVQANSIFANTGLGIDLGGDGVTPNDADDSDTGANDLQNFPVLTHVSSYGGRTYFTGTLTSTPESFFTLDLYASSTQDASGFGQGQIYLGSTTVTTDSNGQAPFDFSLVGSVVPGSFVTATADSGNSGTSEFSQAFQVPTSETLVFTVNTADDVDDPAPNPAHFSLREAIEAANSHPGQDTIQFNLASGKRTIAPLTPLPDITDPVIIDGTSQPGYAGLPLVQLDGTQAGADGLHITGGGSIIRGLVINRFEFDIALEGQGGNRIEGNFLGTDITGTNALPNQDGAGLFIHKSANNLIGGTTAASRNLIITAVLEGADSIGNRLEGNYIDTDITGTTLLSTGTNVDVRVSGINILPEDTNGDIELLDSPSFTTIGGLDQGAGNLIGNGIVIFSGSNDQVQGNLIGTNSTGTALLATTRAGAVLGGVYVGATNSLIGGLTAAARNIVPGGIVVGGQSDRVQGNYLGTDVTGRFALEVVGAFAFAITNFAGVLLGGTGNTIGGTDPGAGNLISGFLGSGVRLTGQNDLLEGNLIGTDVTGSKPLANVIGVSVDTSAFNNTIGGSEPGAGNLISGNSQTGLVLAGFGGDTVQGNLIGTDRTGTLPLGNSHTGAPESAGIIVGEARAVIGGIEAGQGNVISANNGSGILVQGTGPAGISILGNFIGTDVTGTHALGNRGDGINLSGSSNVFIGFGTDGAGNVISANAGNGISIASIGITIQGNRIGTDVSGLMDFGNGGDGISIVESSYLAMNETIGGVDPGAGNVIAFNHLTGVSALFGTGNFIRGNDIFANGGLGIIADVNGVLSTYAEQRGVDLPHNAPVLTSADFDSLGTLVTGTLTGTPFTAYDIDLFASDAADLSGFGEGQSYLQSISVLTDASGSASFTLRLDAPVAIGKWLTATATATDSGGNTSPFSQALPVVAAVAPITFQFTAPFYEVTEGGGAAVVVVTRVGSTTGAASVDFATSDGSAKGGVSYTPQSGTLTFNDGEASKTITIPIEDNSAVNGDQNFSIALSNPTGASLGGSPDATVTIADDDLAGQISFSADTIPFTESFGPPPIVVKRTGGSMGRVTVDYRVTGGSATPLIAGSSLDQAVDYEDFYGTLTFEDGQTTATISVTTFDDFLNQFNPNGPVFEGPETIEVTLGNPSGGATLGSVTKTVMTVRDDDDIAGGFAVLPNGSASEGGGPAELEILRTGILNRSQTVDFTTQDGTARAGINYTALSGTITFNPGEEEKFIEIPILSDLKEGDPGIFRVVLSNPTGGAILDAGHEQLDTHIFGNDSPGHFLLGTQQINENAGTATIFVQRLGGTRGSVSVDFATSDGTARAGADYIATSGTLTFNNGETGKTFTVPILPDNLVEGDETFFITLSNPTGGSFNDDPSPVAETIYESAGHVQFVSSNYDVAENNASLTVVVTLDLFPDLEALLDPNGRLPGPVTVNFATRDGTAQAGSDYTAVSGTLTFDGSLPQSITIPILDDSLVENDETFFLILSDTTGGISVAGDGTTTITIRDDDVAQQQLVLNPGAPYTINEGDGLTLAASITGGTATDLTWDLNGDGVFGDAVGANPTLTPAQLQALGIVDGPGVFTVRVRATDGAGKQITSAAVTLSIGNVPPTALFTNAGPVVDGSAGGVSFTGPTDPSPADVQAGFRYSYDFDNDGTFEIVNSTAASAPVPVSFLNRGPGNYTIAGRIEDKDGGFTDHTTTIVVNPAIVTDQPGQITGIVFVDFSADGVQQPNEPGLAGISIYLDTNNNGRFDAGETRTTSDQRGAYRFVSLAPASYRVRLDFEPAHGIVATSTSALSIDVSSGATSAGQNFGVVLISQVGPVEVIGNRFGSGHSAEAAFVNGLFRNLLARTPEPAGLAFWTGILSSSSDSLAARDLISKLIWESPEHRGLEVAHYYATYLHRRADSVGMTNFVAEFLGGADEQHVVLGFVESAEYQKINSGPTAFVQALYRDLLSRNADVPELEYWVNFIQTANTQTAALSIMNSSESRLRIVDGFYAALLHRSGEEGGRSFWLSKFADGEVTIESAAVSFLGGTLNVDEYFIAAQASVA